MAILIMETLGMEILSMGILNMETLPQTGVSHYGNSELNLGDIFL